MAIKQQRLRQATSIFQSWLLQYHFLELFPHIAVWLKKYWIGFFRTFFFKEHKTKQKLQKRKKTFSWLCVCYRGNWSQFCLFSMLSSQNKPDWPSYFGSWWHVLLSLPVLLTSIRFHKRHRLHLLSFRPRILQSHFTRSLARSLLPLTVSGVGGKRISQSMRGSEALNDAIEFWQNKFVLLPLSPRQQRPEW